MLHPYFELDYSNLRTATSYLIEPTQSEIIINDNRKVYYDVEISRDEKIDLVEHASWTVIAQMLLNMDETLTRG